MCELKKTFYKLKQAPRTWFEKLKSALKSCGLNGSRCDTSLLFKIFYNNVVIVLIYIDDIIIIQNNSALIEETIKKMNKIFVFKDLEELYYFLVIEVT